MELISGRGDADEEVTRDAAATYAAGAAGPEPFAGAWRRDSAGLPPGNRFVGQWGIGRAHGFVTFDGEPLDPDTRRDRIAGARSFSSRLSPCCARAESGACHALGVACTASGGTDDAQRCREAEGQRRSGRG